MFAYCNAKALPYKINPLIVPSDVTSGEEIQAGFFNLFYYAKKIKKFIEKTYEVNGFWYFTGGCFLF